MAPWFFRLGTQRRRDLGVHLKVLIAAFLTLWLAMRLELPQPRTAMITVFIVMQPQSGQVFAKSFYRFLGTLAGSAVMVLLIALLRRTPNCFWAPRRSGSASAPPVRRATVTSVPMGLCLPVIPRRWLAYRRWPIRMAPSWRPFGEYWKSPLGYCAPRWSSAAILPQTSSAAMRNALYQRFGVFAQFVTDGLRGRSQREGFEASNVRFIAEAVGPGRAAQRYRVRRPAYAPAQWPAQSPATANS